MRTSAGRTSPRFRCKTNGMSDLKTKTGAVVPGYLAERAGASGAVIVIHEYWGLTDQIRSVADRFASEGFTAFAVDLYNGITTTNGERAGELLSRMSWDEALRTVKLAAEALQTKGYPKLGITGFCLGGAVALFAAAKLPATFQAVIPFYGIPPEDKADLGELKARVQGHFANTDDWITPERVTSLAKTLERSKVDAEIHRYDAKHAFANEARPEVYSKPDAEAAYARAFAFLRAHLR